MVDSKEVLHLVFVGIFDSGFESFELKKLHVQTDHFFFPFLSNLIEKKSNFLKKFYTEKI